MTILQLSRIKFEYYLEVIKSGSIVARIAYDIKHKIKLVDGSN
jgi:hypothetical protein